MHLRQQFTYPKRALLSSAAGLFLSLLVAGCATAPGQMTQAALQGDTATLDELLQSGSTEVNTAAIWLPQSACPGQRIMTPLQAAACTGQAAAIQKLLASRANIDLAIGAGQPPLILAIAHGRDDAARLLVESGARLENTDAAGNTPLLIAAESGKRALAAFLLKNGASPKARNKAGDTALLLSTDAGLSKMLAGLGADPLAVNAAGESGLHRAARTGNAQTARFFLEHGVDAGLRNQGGVTALDLARASTDAVAASSVRSTRRGRPMASGSGAATVVDPAQANNRAEVAAVIEAWADRTARQKAAAADKAARDGRSAEALALYATALARADDAGSAAGNDLRVKIVRYAASLPQQPGLPAKAREHLVRSSYLLKKGQDIGLVEKEMAAALRLAPWWVEGYYNLGQLQAEQGKFDAAERNLQRFIEAVPADPRAQAAQDKIYETRMAREEEGKIRGMQGSWVERGGAGYTVKVNGDKILIHSGSGLAFTLTQRNGALEGSVAGGARPGANSCTIPAQMHPVTGRLSPDARSITLEYLWSRYKTSYHCVNMAGVPSNCCLLCDKVCDAVTVNGTDQVKLQLQPAR